MPNLNITQIIGHLCRDAETRSVGSGNTVTGFTIATTHKWQSADGQKKEDTAFIDCEAWGKTGEAIAKYTGKGDPLYVQGRLKLEQWEDKETKAKRSKMKVVVERFEFLKSKGDSAPAKPQQEDDDSSVPF